MRFNAASAVAAAAVAAATALFHLRDMLGAQAWWGTGTRTGLLAAGMGAALFLALHALRVPARAPAFTGAAGLLLAGSPRSRASAAWPLPKATTFAGRLRYLGWIGAAATSMLLLTALGVSSLH